MFFGVSLKDNLYFVTHSPAGGDIQQDKALRSNVMGILYDHMF